MRSYSFLACLTLVPLALACTDDGVTDTGVTGILPTTMGTLSDGDPTGGGLPKWDLAGIPDANSNAGGGDIGIPETCNQAEQVESSVGCLFYTLDMDNLSSGETSDYGVIVSNVQEDTDAVVEIEQKVNGNWQTVAGPQAIAALDSQTFVLPDNHQEGSGLKVGGAYRITSDVPTIAYEFNPLDGQVSYTTDASLLYPVPSWDYLYDILGYHVTIGYGSYAVVVASEDNTVIEVTPADPTAAGTGIPAGQPGVPFQLNLDEGDVAQIATEGNNNSMTGTTITSDEQHPIGVFTGTECTNTGQGACDHMEEMLTGIRLWGTEFVASRMPIRQVNNPENTIWQIYASEDNTTVSFEATGGVSGLPGGSVNLDRGDYVEYPVTGTMADPGDFFITADRPIAVMAYLVGVQAGEGDPAMVQMSPVAQYLPRYVVLVPPTWINDFLIITRPEGATVEVDGVAVNDMEFIPVGNGDYEVARLDIPDGVHTVDGTGSPVSVIVVGFDSYDSYAYLGGVGTSVINPSPQG